LDRISELADRKESNELKGFRREVDQKGVGAGRL
jgi:hypothetical protein